MNYHEEEEDKGEDRIRKLEAVMKQFDRANTVFHEAITADTVEKRKELLEQAVREYTEILPLLPRMNSWDIRLI
ncbi:MAG: hypothetical protein RMI32_07575, partial [Candidatus Nitrosocaldus sp.]|nr:hypothetical protein [Candidatus Nitrosocaldus sp.]